MSTQKTLCLVVSISVLSLVGIPSTKPTQAQSITPAADGTGTIVSPNGQQFQIDGGTLSKDGKNLFHSFQQFGLSSGQIATFLSQPQIRNILGRVVGGDASIINGLVQVTGGNSNLFLMNPAGIIFGAGAQLNVPASFMATTANGIGFGGGWFNAVGNNNYQDLLGSPTSLAFTLSQPGSIVNAGNLAVGQGQTLALIGGTTINTGTVSAPGGKITIAAVPGTSQVQLSQEGMVLSLKLNAANLSNNGLSPESLPGLITGGNSVAATGVSVDADGQVWLTASNTQIPRDTGTAIVSGTIDASNSNSGQTGGTINILGEKVGLISANINASGSNAGGTVLVGGDYQGEGTIPKAQRTFVSSDSVINADALANGDGGRVIVWAEDTTQFFGNISTRGGEAAGNGGFVEISGKDKLQFDGTVDTSASNGNFGTLLLDPTDITITAGGGGAGFSGQVLSGDAGPTTITENQLESLPWNTNVVIQATNSITLEKMTGGLIPNELTFASVPPGSNPSSIGAIAFQAGGAFTMDQSDRLNTSGRNLTIEAASITAGQIISSFGPVGSSVTLTATNGGITASDISANKGTVTLNATNGITVTTIDARNNDGSSGGGTIKLNGVTSDSSFLQNVNIPGSPGSSPGTPVTNPGTPVTNPDTPVTNPDTPSTVIGTNGVILNLGSTGSRTGAANSSGTDTPVLVPGNLAVWNQYQFQQPRQADMAYRARQNQQEIQRTEGWIEWDAQMSEYNADWGRYETQRGNPESASTYFKNSEYYSNSAAMGKERLQQLQQNR